jgi:hypothetical protein
MTVAHEQKRDTCRLRAVEASVAELLRRTAFPSARDSRDLRDSGRIDARKRKDDTTILSVAVGVLRQKTLHQEALPGGDHRGKSNQRTNELIERVRNSPSGYINRGNSRKNIESP